MVECVPEKGVIGKQFRKDAKPIMEWLAGLDESAVQELEWNLETNGYGDLGTGNAWDPTHFTLNTVLFRVSTHGCLQGMVQTLRWALTRRTLNYCPILSSWYSSIHRSHEALVNGKTYTILPNMVTVKRYQKTIHGRPAR